MARPMSYEQELRTTVDKLFEGYAPEYVLTAVRDHLIAQSKKPGYLTAGLAVNNALEAICLELPGYRNEIIRRRHSSIPTLFNPKW